ncbi:MAG: hypothetical protein IPP19_09585 [Verrucomicrobia bacterium]|nr:hypothetical protein [Verrucomicrobiota bacterium]
MKLQPVKPLYFLRLLGLLAVLTVSAHATEYNVSPFWNGQTAGETPRPIQDWTAIGPLFFHQTSSTTADSGQTSGGIRPLYVWKTDPDHGKSDAYFLYPLFSYRSSPNGYNWSLLSLINHYSAPQATTALGTTSAEPTPSGFDLWPIYYSRQTSDPASSYHAVFPLYGTIKHRFGQDKLTWVLFPLYARFEKRNVSTTTAPWPFIKVLNGEGNHGFELWPLFGYRAKEGAYREQFYLWPLIFKEEHALWKSQPDTAFGFLPFYMRETSTSLRRETYLWPFFGYTDRTAPVRYHETRYLWPFFVQGRGDVAYVNRWSPFYSHSVVKGVDKTWVLWPLWCHRTWTDSGLHQARDQFLWFIYSSTKQRSATNPNLAPAHKTHLWPLVSIWDNGAGRKQVQAFSPLLPFFPTNEPIRIAWNPLFAIYRYDREALDDRRHTLLWNFVSWRRSPQQREFHLGPIFSVDKGNAANRIALGCGIIGLKRETPASRWRLFFFDFRRRPAKAATTQP